MARLLATSHTPTNGGVYLLDTDTGSVQQVTDAPCRGITRGPDGYYAVENYGVIHHLDPITWAVTRRAETGHTWCHDLKWFNGSFYLVVSKGNRIVRMDAEFRTLDEMQIVQDEDDVCHANCLELADDQLILSIFTLSPGVRQDKNGTDAWRHEGKVLRLDWANKTFDVLYEPLSQPHSLTWRNGQIFCCESYTSRVSVISPQSGTRTQVRRLNGFVRGLALSEDRAFVGITRRRLEAYHPLLRWWGRWTRWCGVMELDRKTWKPLRRHLLPGRQVYDVLLLDEV